MQKVREDHLTQALMLNRVKNWIDDVCDEYEFDGPLDKDQWEWLMLSIEEG